VIVVVILKAGAQLHIGTLRLAEAATSLVAFHGLCAGVAQRTRFLNYLPHKNVSEESTLVGIIQAHSHAKQRKKAYGHIPFFCRPSFQNTFQITILPIPEKIVQLNCLRLIEYGEIMIVSAIFAV
jgi:hypothetical protein